MMDHVIQVDHGQCTHFSMNVNKFLKNGTQPQATGLPEPKY